MIDFKHANAKCDFLMQYYLEDYVMKVLAVSFGRKNKNCDIVAKQALIAAKAAGAEVKHINTMNMVIGHCIGCGACSNARKNGKQIKCILKDDYLTLENAVLDADAVLVVAPVYSIAPTGQLKNYIDRFGAAHDLAAIKDEQEKRIAAGTELLDERLFKKKYLAYISVGGAATQNWVSLGLPNFYMFGMSTAWDVVGQIDGYNMGRRVNPVLDAEFTKQVTDLGVHLAKCAKEQPEKPEWFGDEGTCPVCHNNLITVNGTTTIECPMCGIYGKISIDGDKVNVTFSEEEQARARNTFVGLTEHFVELGSMMDVIIPALQTRSGEIEAGMKPILEFESTY